MNGGFYACSGCNSYLCVSSTGVSVMLVQRLGIVFFIFMAFALSFGSFVNYTAKYGRDAHLAYQGKVMQDTRNN